MDIVHKPVMPDEVAEYLTPTGGEGLVIDATCGEGGHSERFLRDNPGLEVVGIDADPRIQEVARKRLAPYGDRMRFVSDWFDRYFAEYPKGEAEPDSILMDLGISVFHYESSGGGFSFRKDEPLDMRLSPEATETAADVVNGYSQDELRRIFGEYGEERYSGRIATAIVKRRANTPIRTSGDLADIIWEAVPASYRHGRIHPGTRCFQALRIVVNRELERLDSALRFAFSALKVGGRLGVISFHSLEDRRVKWFFREMAKSCICPPEQPQCTCGGEPAGKILTKRPLTASEAEVADNSPSRSAKFRVLEKLKDRS